MFIWLSLPSSVGPPDWCQDRRKQNLDQKSGVRLSFLELNDAWNFKFHSKIQLGKLWIRAICEINPPNLNDQEGHFGVRMGPLLNELVFPSGGDFGRCQLRKNAWVGSSFGKHQVLWRTKIPNHHDVKTDQITAPKKKHWANPTAARAIATTISGGRQQKGVAAHSPELWKLATEELPRVEIPPQSRRSFSLKAFLVIFWGDPYDPYGSLDNWVTMSSALCSTLNFPGFFFRINVRSESSPEIFPAKIQSIFKGTENTRDAIAGHHKNLWYSIFLVP